MTVWWKLLTIYIKLGPITKQYVSTWRDSTVVGPSMRKIQALHWQIVDTGVCLRVVFPLTLIISASMGVNESWMRFLRVFEPVNTVFSITGPSVYCTVQGHRTCWLNAPRCRLMEQSWDVQTWTIHTDSNTPSKFKWCWVAAHTVVSSWVWSVYIWDL